MNHRLNIIKYIEQELAKITSISVLNSDNSEYENFNVNYQKIDDLVNIDSTSLDVTIYIHSLNNINNQIEKNLLTRHNTLTLSIAIVANRIDKILVAQDKLQEKMGLIHKAFRENTAKIAVTEEIEQIILDNNVYLKYVSDESSSDVNNENRVMIVNMNYEIKYFCNDWEI